MYTSNSIGSGLKEGEGYEFVTNLTYLKMLTLFRVFISNAVR